MNDMTGNLRAVGSSVLFGREQAISMAGEWLKLARGRHGNQYHWTVEQTASYYRDLGLIVSFIADCWPEPKTMITTPELKEVGCGAVVRLAGDYVTPKAKPDSPGWWWRFQPLSPELSSAARDKWVCGEVSALDDAAATLVWQYTGFMCDLSSVHVHFPGALWVKAELPTFAPNAVRSGEAMDAVPNVKPASGGAERA